MNGANGGDGAAQAYCSCIESYLEKRVGEDIEGFSLDAFGKMMATRKVR